MAGQELDELEPGPPDCLQRSLELELVDDVEDYLAWLAELRED